MKVYFLHTIRSIKYGFQNFGRNIFLSIATTSVMVLTLFGLGFFLIINQISSQALVSLQDQIDISLYIRDNVTDETLNAFEQHIQNTANVRTVEVINKEGALKIFEERFKDSPGLIDSIRFLDQNPLPVTITIQAEESRFYEQITQDIQSFEGYGDIVENSDFERQTSRDTIDRLNAIISTSRNIGLTVIIILAVIAVLITYNTIRLTMYSYRSEIEVMRLVGASDMQIKGPFLVEGILFGIFGTIISFVILFIVVLSISDPINQFIPESESLFDYLVDNIVFIVALKLAIGVALGVGSGLIAINRYLKV